jgi:hypothetical protein
METSNFDKIIDEWKARIDKKTEAITADIDKAVLKAAIYCEGQAKINAMTMIYDIPIPKYPDGTAMWSRTGLYKASIGCGMNPNALHGALVYNTAPYAREIEYGSSDAPGAARPGRQGRPIMINSVFNNKPQIEKIIKTYLAEAIK